MLYLLYGCEQFSVVSVISNITYFLVCLLYSMYSLIAMLQPKQMIHTFKSEEKEEGDNYIWSSTEQMPLKVFHLMAVSISSNELCC